MANKKSDLVKRVSRVTKTEEKPLVPRRVQEGGVIVHPIIPTPGPPRNWLADEGDEEEEEEEDEEDDGEVEVDDEIENDDEIEEDDDEVETDEVEPDVD